MVALTVYLDTSVVTRMALSAQALGVSLVRV